MRMKLFRDKLAQEITEVESLIEIGDALDQQIQANIYCIAALLRRILARVDKPKRFTVKAYDMPDRGAPRDVNIPLDTISRAISHYSVFAPASFSVTGTRTAVTLLGDRDNELRRREIDLKDYIGAAKIVAEEGVAIIDEILRYTKKHLSRLNFQSTVSRSAEMEGMEALIDIFDLIRETGRERWINGSLIFFTRDYNPENISDITGAQASEVEYDALFNNLFRVWNYLPFRQFGTYDSDDSGLGLRGKKVIDIERLSGQHIIILRLDDMIALLDTLDNTPFDTPNSEKQKQP